MSSFFETNWRLNSDELITTIEKKTGKYVYKPSSYEEYLDFKRRQYHTDLLNIESNFRKYREFSRQMLDFLTDKLDEVIRKKEF